MVPLSALADHYLKAFFNLFSSEIYEFSEPEPSLAFLGGTLSSLVPSYSELPLTRLRPTRNPIVTPRAFPPPSNEASQFLCLGGAQRLSAQLRWIFLFFVKVQFPVPFIPALAFI